METIYLHIQYWVHAGVLGATPARVYAHIKPLYSKKAALTGGLSHCTDRGYWLVVHLGAAVAARAAGTAGRLLLGDLADHRFGGQH